MIAHTTHKRYNFANLQFTQFEIVNRLDTELPNGSITSTPDDWTNQDVTLQLTATDTGGSGIRRVQTPDSQWVNDASASYIAKGNSMYSFRVEDNAGNVRIILFRVDNIDRAAPSETKIKIDVK